MHCVFLLLESDVFALHHPSVSRSNLLHLLSVLLLGLNLVVETDLLELLFARRA